MNRERLLWIGTALGLALVIALIMYLVWPDVDDLSRFKTAAQLASYFGLTPGENSTGGKQRFTGVTKAGKTQVRTLLIQAAWTLVRVAPASALAQGYQQLVQRRPKQVAIVALARRMVCALFAMMRVQFQAYMVHCGRESFCRVRWLGRFGDYLLLRLRTRIGSGRLVEGSLTRSQPCKPQAKAVAAQTR